jgi:peptidoglycan hydrolase-like protein with peptidoglycan-binding domain
MLTSTAKKAARAAAALIVAATGIAVLGAGSPASAAVPVCTTYSESHWDLDGVWVNDRWPAPYGCNLRQGNTGNGVKVLQYLLACNGHWTLPDGRKVQRDGNFGPITKEAVRLMQIDLGVTADGEYGPITASAVASRGSYPVFKDEAWWFYACS